LTILDVFTRESLTIEVGQGFKGEDVVRGLNATGQKRGAPKLLFCNNGSEFKSMDLWAYQNGAHIDFSQPGKPSDNAYCGVIQRHLAGRVFGHALVRHPGGGQADHRGANSSSPIARREDKFASQIAASRDLTCSTTAGDYSGTVTEKEDRSPGIFPILSWRSQPVLPLAITACENEVNLRLAHGNL
jgi:putative transposase